MLRTITNALGRTSFFDIILGNANSRTGDYKTSIYYSRAGNIKANKVGAVEYISTSPDGEEENEESIILGFLQDIYGGNGIKELAQNWVRSRDDHGVFIAKKIRTPEDRESNADLTREGQIIGLQVLDPTKITLKIEKGVIQELKFSYEKNTKTIRGEELEDYIIKPTAENNIDWAETTEVKNFIGNAIRLQTLLDLEANIRNLELSSIKRNLNINGFFSMKNAISEEQVKKFKERVKQEYSGTDRGGGFIVGSDFDFKQYNDPTLSHNDFLEKIEKDIFTAKGVPELLSAGSQGSQYYAGRQTIQLFYDMTILPEIEEFIEMINTEIVPEFDLEERERIGYLNPVPRDVDAEATVVPSLVGTVISQNEARARIGEPPLEDDRADMVVYPGEEFNPSADLFKTPQKKKRNRIYNRRAYLKHIKNKITTKDV